MLRWIAVALVAAAAAGTATILLDGPSPGPDVSVQQAVWHMDGTVTHEERWCSTCHYDQQRVWTAAWEADGPMWNLSVAPAFRGVGLIFTQAAADPVLWASGELRHDWSPDAPWAVEFEVPAGAGGIFARVHAEPGPPAPELAATDRHTELVLLAPDGTRHAAGGPESDLKILVVVDPEPGTWSMEATLADAVNGSATGRAWMEVLGGQVAPGPATFQMPAGPDGRPPETTLRVRPYHDHRLYEDSDWDHYDAAPARETFEPQPGPRTPQVQPGEDAILAAWQGSDSVVFDSRDVLFLGAYENRAGHRDDQGVGTSKPHYYPASGGVPLGARLLRFDFTWATPTDEPRLNLRFSPPGTPLYFDAEPVLRKPGRLVLEALIDPDWPIVAGGIWDLAPYLEAPAGARQTEYLSAHLEATAFREPPPGNQRLLDACSRLLEDCTYDL